MDGERARQISDTLQSIEYWEKQVAFAKENDKSALYTAQEILQERKDWLKLLSESDIRASDVVKIAKAKKN